ncbi:MAG: hypothetical protein ACLP9Y_23650, partial [Mycobacterium sp.]
YAGHVGFLTDPARVRSPKDKPRVERAVQYVRRNFWDGETFTSLDEAQRAATAWCARTAGTRIHGSTCARPLEVFTTAEQALLLPVPGVYDVPVFKAVKVHRDFHLLTELIPRFGHVSAVIDGQRFYRRCHVRGLRGRARSVGVGGAGGGVAGSDGLEVGAVSVARGSGPTGGGRRVVLR